MPMNPEFEAAAVQSRAAQGPLEKNGPFNAIASLNAIDPRGVQVMAMFMQMDERHKKLFVLQMSAALRLQREPTHG